MRNSITPRVTPDTQGFWQGCAQGELRAQRCGQCGRLRFPPQPMCPACRSMERDWVPVAGTGQIYAYSVITGAGGEKPLPGTQGIPYAVAIIELDEGIKMVTDFDTEVLDSLHVGMPVRAVFERLNDDITIPRFAAVSN